MKKFKLTYIFILFFTIYSIGSKNNLHIQFNHNISSIIENDDTLRLKLSKIKNNLPRFLQEEYIYKIEPNLTVLTYQQAKFLFDKIKADPTMPYLAANQNCFARAQRMTRIIEKYNIDGSSPIQAGRVFLEVIGNNTTMFNALTFKHPLAISEFVWIYHTAPLIKVKTSKGIFDYVIDPSIALNPVPLEYWVNWISKDVKSENYLNLFKTSKTAFTLVDAEKEWPNDYTKHNLKEEKKLLKKDMKLHKIRLQGKEKIK